VVLAVACATGSPSGRAPAPQATSEPAPAQPAAPALEKPPDFHVIAHRGGAAHAPENTLPAFRRSLAQGFDEVELDVRLSLDEQLVLYHDHTLERKTGHEGSVGVYTAEELKQFELGSWFEREHPEVVESFAGANVTTLDELFGEFGDRLYYHIEIKGEDPRVPGLLSRAIDAAGLRQRVTVSSFSLLQLTRFAQFDRDVPLCWLLDRNREFDRESLQRWRQQAQIETARRSGVSQVAVAADEISRSIVDYAHANGIGIRAWGVENAEHEQRVIDAGSDGATTDWPERLQARLAERTRASGAQE